MEEIDRKDWMEELGRTRLHGGDRKDKIGFRS